MVNYHGSFTLSIHVYYVHMYMCMTLDCFQFSCVYLGQWCDGNTCTCSFTFMVFHDTHLLLGISCPMQPPNVSQLPSMQSPAQLPTSQSTVIHEGTCTIAVATNIEYESFWGTVLLL